MDRRPRSGHRLAIVVTVFFGAHVHHGDEGPREGSVFVIAKRGGNLADTQGGVEKAVASRSHPRVNEITFGGGAQELLESSFERAHRHAGLVGQRLDGQFGSQILVDAADQFGDRPMGSGEWRTFAMFESSGNSSGADDVIILIKQGNL